jgi:hypothetical protein
MEQPSDTPRINARITPMAVQDVPGTRNQLPMIGLRAR